jgi:hypothetical protein
VVEGAEGLEDVLAHVGLALAHLDGLGLPQLPHQRQHRVRVLGETQRAANGRGCVGEEARGGGGGAARAVDGEGDEVVDGEAASGHADALVDEGGGTHGEEVGVGGDAVARLHADRDAEAYYGAGLKEVGPCDGASEVFHDAAWE